MRTSQAQTGATCLVEIGMIEKKGCLRGGEEGRMCIVVGFCRRTGDGSIGDAENVCLFCCHSTKIRRRVETCSEKR